MCRHLFTAALLVLVLCQTAIAQRSGFGLKGGLMASSATAQQVRTSIIPGATAGIYAPFHAGARMEIQPELLISAMGAGFTYPDGDQVDLRTLMVQVPVSVKVFLSNSFNLQTGVQFGKVLAAYRTQDEERTTITEEMRPVDMGVTFGLGGDLSSGVDLTLRYYNGLWTILSEDDALFARNRTLQMTLGYRLVSFKGFTATRKRR